VFPLESFRCLTVDCRGHGESEAGDPAAFGIATFADDVAAVLDDMKVGPLPVGGISMGAAIALRLAVTRPDLVSALILARPAWATDPAPANMQVNGIVGRLIAEHDPAEARAAFERTPVARALAIEAPDNLASLRSFFARTPHGVTADLLVRISADGPGVTPEQVRGIRVPTLVIGHARDVVHPLGLARDLSSLIPGARLAVIPPKADDLEGYRSGFRASLRAFLIEHDPA
jgi:pimeloyl-ACP methyl ester carboxylesterase